MELLLLKDRRWPPNLPEVLLLFNEARRSSRGMVVGLVGMLLRGRRTERRRKEVVVLEEAAHVQDVARRLPDRQSMAWRPVAVCG